MFDELLDLFERYGRKRKPRSRNLLSRLADLARDTDDRPSGRRHDRQGDDDDDHRARGGRRPSLEWDA